LSGGNVAGCTIISPNYLGYARTVAASYLRQHPGQRFFVLIVAALGVDARAKFAGDQFTPVMLDELGLADVRGLGMRYDILELNTNVKPTFLKYLIARYELERLIYLDPDIFVYKPLTPVLTALDGGATAVLTPHLTMPVNDGKRPSEQDMLYNGTFNLGFVAVRRCAESGRLLDWWEERCLEQGFHEGRTGLFVDQKWMNLAPGMFAGVEILRDAGCNMAYWNLQERVLRAESDGYVVEPAGVPLRFFHFSGIDVKDAAVLSNNADRFTLVERPDLARIFAEYKTAVLANGDAAVEALPYGFDKFSDGTVVTRLARRIYAEKQARWAGEDPFDARGGFAAFAKKLGLVAGKDAPGRSTWKQFNAQDRRVVMVHRLLRMALRVLGPNRYELLMRYLGHITVLRNQAVFLDDTSSK
jgi:hypothetical protein